MKRIRLVLAALLCLAGAAVAQAQGQGTAGESPDAFYAQAKTIGDPTTGSQIAYDALLKPDEVDLYAFTASRDGTLPVEVLIPARASNRDFRPTVAVIGPGLSGSENQLVPFPLHSDFQVLVVQPPDKDKRDTIVEPLSVEKLYRGTSQPVSFVRGLRYYLAVYDPGRRTGDYVLGLGDQKSFGQISPSDYLDKGLALKFNLPEGRDVPALDWLGFFAMLAGLILGLGSVSVIDLLGLRGVRSAYWTETAIRASKATTPLTWAGVGVFLAGSLVLYRETGFSGVATFQELLLLIIIVNGLWLTFRISPKVAAFEGTGKTLPAKLQRRVIGHFGVSFVAWWGIAGLTAWYAVVSR